MTTRRPDNGTMTERNMPPIHPATAPPTDIAQPPTTAAPPLLDVMEACRRVEADATLPSAIRSAAGELADEIAWELDR